MTPEGAPSRSQVEKVRTRAGGRYENLALALLAILILVASSWFQPASRGEVLLEERSVRPLRIDVNRAPWYEWVLLEGIGDARARSIVAFREKQGRFRSVGDLERVPGMPAGWVEKARQYLCVGGANQRGEEKKEVQIEN